MLVMILVVLFFPTRAHTRAVTHSRHTEVVAAQKNCHQFNFTLGGSTYIIIIIIITI
jgi:hypothetical protein